MSNYVNIKISKADLPIPFIITNERMDKDRPHDHWQANGYCAINKKYSVYWHDYTHVDIDIHWGLTFAESLNQCEIDFPHVYEAYLKQPNTSKDDEVRIFGFDTAHAWDTKAERTKEAVEGEARFLQKQLLSFYVPTDEEIAEASND